MARVRKEDIQLGEEIFAFETLPMAELGKVLPFYRRYLDTVGAGGLLAEGGMDAAIDLLAAALKRERDEIAALRTNITEIAEAIVTIGEICGLEFRAVGEAAARAAGEMTGSISAPSMPLSPQAAATDTPTSTG